MDCSESLMMQATSRRALLLGELTGSADQRHPVALGDIEVAAEDARSQAGRAFAAR